jgi:hypothetical protein
MNKHEWKWTRLWIIPVMLFAITCEMLSDALHGIYVAGCNICDVNTWEA